ncbi:hypothetical protein SAMN04490248_12738 [Salinihabitans flavidus]|uniref:Uncharacterized protein n=1 Tax=Salinihabitans flavidus TaxID=569882 RepID=A0A1H8VBW6_9RHOB|nr:hypothetical protein SAMN04490248_12738 [Salinihabitans flavidus]
MYFKHLKAGVAAVALSVVALPAAAQDDDDGLTTTQELRAEVSETMEAIVDYSAQQRDQALAQGREMLNQLDAEIARREQALRENWSEMSEAAQETARERMRDLRQARNALGERFGALQSGASDVWSDLKAGFSDAWDRFSDAWSAADEDAAGQTEEMGSDT